MREVNRGGTCFMLPSTKWARKDHSHVVGQEKTTTSLDLVIAVMKVQAWALCTGLFIENAAWQKTVQDFLPLQIL